jgi:hypothetical protein
MLARRVSMVDELKVRQAAAGRMEERACLPEEKGSWRDLEYSE